MTRSPTQLRTDALAIWQAGVDAVRSDRLVADNVQVDGDWLLIGDESFELQSIGRIAVVGAGKAGAGMAAGLLSTLGERVIAEKQLTGWVNVPQDCVALLPHITLHGARPAGVNEPTEAGVAGTREILEIASSLGPRDLCICLISGGGSALLPAPTAGITLAEKLALTRHLSAAGANIRELNAVRTLLSDVKGGGLARACTAGRLVSLIISDVPGDPLDVIASGPTIVAPPTVRDVAFQALHDYGAKDVLRPESLDVLKQRHLLWPERPPPACEVTNIVIGNNAVAVDAAGVEAERRGYSHAMLASRELEGPAEEIGRHLASMAYRMRAERGPDCLITGGEPIVRLAPAERRGKGGRNQQLVLTALLERMEQPQPTELSNPLEGIAILSGGTDGEDGPTDAAGAYVDAAALARMDMLQLDPRDYLMRNDAYHFFEQLGALIKTGPTHTNVCDVRVAVVDREEVRAKGC